MAEEDPTPPGNDAEALERIRACHRGDTFNRSLGFELLEGGLGYAVVGTTVRDEQLNFYGSVHGGLVFALADAAFSFACNSAGRKAVAVNAFISYLKPALAGERLTATAREVSRSARLGNYAVEVANAAGEVIATFTGISYLSGKPGRIAP